MQRSQAGDRESYRQLLKELTPALRAFVRSAVGETAWLDDCVQECLLAIHRARASYDPRRPFRPWLFAIARHKLVDSLRRAGPGAAWPRAEPARAPGSSEGVESDPARRLDAARALAALDPSSRRALLLTKLEGHSLAEAARAEGVSVGAMKTRVHRAIRRVKRWLEGGDG